MLHSAAQISVSDDSNPDALDLTCHRDILVADNPRRTPATQLGLTVSGEDILLGHVPHGVITCRFDIEAVVEGESASDRAAQECE